MRLDELLKTMLQSFFVITTGVVVSMFVFCLLFYPDASFTLMDIGRILLMALCSDLLFLLFYSRKELGKKQMLVRQVLHFAVLLGVLLYFAQLWDWVSMQRPAEIAVFAALATVVYVLVVLVGAYQDKKLADQLNSRLKERYHS